jgi:hypothetical protein
VRLKGFSLHKEQTAPVRELYLPREGAIFFFLTLSGGSIGLAVALLIIPLVQSQLFLFDVIFFNCRLFQR